MDSQALANSLEALVVLEERLSILELPVIATAGAARLVQILPEVKGKELVFNVPIMLWACAKSGRCGAELFAAVAGRFASRKCISSLPPRSLCALAWTYRHHDEEGVYSDLLDRLESEISKRGLREEEVLATRA